MSANVDLIIYSYNRPLQLYALLESIEKHVTGLSTINIFYKTSNDVYHEAYEQVKSAYPHAFFYQENSSRVKAILESTNPYVLFSPDDLIVKASVDLDRCIETLKKTDAYAFFLRLGLNINYCHVAKLDTPVPPVTLIEKDIYSYVFANGKGDWNFPHNFDMTLYRKKDIKAALMALDLTTPHCEGIWARSSPQNRAGLFFATSKVVNLTINLVNPYSSQEQFSPEWRAVMQKWHPDNLLKVFNDGMKIDLQPLYAIEHRSAHIEYALTYIKR